MDSRDLQTYFRTQQVSLQWLPVLRALARALAEQARPDELRALFSSVGARFGGEAQELFEEVSTLKELEEALNDFWPRINWGWVSLEEVAGRVEIVHQAAPLAEGFGEEMLQWSVGLLEGFYLRVFGVLGASAAMRVRCSDVQSQGMVIHLRLVAESSSRKGRVDDE